MNRYFDYALIALGLFLLYRYVQKQPGGVGAFQTVIKNGLGKVTPTRNPDSDAPFGGIFQTPPPGGDTGAGGVQGFGPGGGPPPPGTS